MASEQAKALIHAFFAERGVSRVPGVSKDTPAAKYIARELNAIWLKVEYS